MAPVEEPLCFLHIPKSGGSSVHAALLAATPEGSLSAKRGDAAVTAFGELDRDARAARDAELVEYELDPAPESGIVSGHFYLSTLLKVASHRSIATVLREPRARLLSLYAFWRLTPRDDAWHPHKPHDHALRPLDEFLSEPLMAPAVDNVVCRMLLSGNHDRRIPPVDVISSKHVGNLASDGIHRLDQLGFVGVLNGDRRPGTASRASSA